MTTNSPDAFGTSSPPDASEVPDHPRRPVNLLAGTIGHFVEWYDWYIYGLLAAVFAGHIFPSHSPFASLIAALLTYAIGFVVRPFSGVIVSPLADRYGRGWILMLATAAIFVFGLFFSALFVGGNLIMINIFLATGMFLMGLTYGPLGTALAEIFPPAVRYTGSSLAFTLAGILGASLTPYLAITLAESYGLSAVGYYLAIAAAISFAALTAARSSMRGK